jgi:hypothetical protein
VLLRHVLVEALLGGESVATGRAFGAAHLGLRLDVRDQRGLDIFDWRFVLFAHGLTSFSLIIAAPTGLGPVAEFGALPAARI